jgi:hypothetical protein
LDLFAKHWGDLASVVGLAVSVFGFVYAISMARQARVAAEQARDAAQAARDRIFSLNTISELIAARMALSEIIRFQRLNVWNISWDIVLERYESARISLVRCEQGHGVPEAQRKSSRTAVALLSIMVVDIDTARIDRDPGRLDTVIFNRRLSTQIEELEKARIAIEKAEI